MTDTIKYLEDGRAVRVVSALPDGQYIVNLGYDDSERETTFFGTDKQVVDAVYDDPPAPALHERVRKLEKRVNELRSEGSTLDRSISERRRALADIERVPGLELFSAVAHRQCQHFIAWSNVHRGARIPESMSEPGNSDAPRFSLRLESGRYDKPEVTCYVRGSRMGDEKCGQPFATYEDAAAAMRTLVIEGFETLTREGIEHFYPWHIEHLTIWAVKLRIDVPAAFAQATTAAEIESARKALAEASAKRDAALERLTSLGVAA